MAKFPSGKNKLGGEMHRALLEKFLTRDRNDAIPIRMKTGDRKWLAEFLGEQGFDRGAEVGVQWGYFSKVLCNRNPNIELYSIDPWLPNKMRKGRNEQKFKKATLRLAKYACTIIRKRSLDAVNDFDDKSLDFIYIDADHHFDEVVQDIIHWMPKIRKGGVIACHDYFHFRYGGVVEAINAYTRAHHIDPWYVTWESTPTAFWFKP